MTTALGSMFGNPSEGLPASTGVGVGSAVADASGVDVRTVGAGVGVLPPTVAAGVGLVRGVAVAGMETLLSARDLHATASSSTNRAATASVRTYRAALAHAGRIVSVDLSELVQ